MSYLDHDDELFAIDQHEDSGAIYIKNVRLVVRGTHVHIERPLNSRYAWPLYLTTPDDEEIFRIRRRWKPIGRDDEIF